MPIRTMIKQYHPRRILEVMDSLDGEAPSYQLTRQQALRRVLIVLATCCVSLLIINYLKFHSSFLAGLQLLSLTQGEGINFYVAQLRANGFLELIGYGWWTFWHLVGYVLVPLFVIKYLLKESFITMGWQLNGVHRHWRSYLLLLSPVLIAIAIVSQGKDFVGFYPFYSYASRSWFDLLAWECLYLLQFVFLEFFFRGFILNALRPAIGANAIWVMCVPYLMIHFPKLWMEASGAILFGIFLGILAMRSRSIWGGFFVHAVVAVTLDLSALLQKADWPDRFWPLIR